MARTLEGVMRDINGSAPVGTLPARYRYQQQQRRIYERRGVFVTVLALQAADQRDPLTLREMWRNCGRPLVIETKWSGARKALRP